MPRPTDDHLDDPTPADLQRDREYDRKREREEEDRCYRCGRHHCRCES